MAARSNTLEYRIIDPCDGLILRFKNDFGGRDLIHFPGNYAVRFETGEVRTIDREITDYSSASVQRGTETVLGVNAGSKISCSRFFDSENKEGAKQLLSSRYVELYNAPKGQNLTIQANAWLHVKLNLRDWSERIKENQIFVAIDIELPERFTDEF